MSVLPHPVLLSNARSRSKSHGMLCRFITQGYEKPPEDPSEKQLTWLHALQQTSAKPCTTTPRTPPERIKTRIRIRHAFGPVPVNGKHRLTSERGRLLPTASRESYLRGAVACQKLPDCTRSFPSSKLPLDISAKPPLLCHCIGSQRV